MKDIFGRKGFLLILVILLYTACVYPPFLLITEAGITVGRKWGWVFAQLPTPSEVPEIDLVMLFIEAIIAVLLALGISLVLSGIRKVLRQRDQFHRKVAKPLLKD